MINKRRSAIAGLSLSAIGLVTILSDESFVNKAEIPTKNDRPTVCFGMTWRPDGSPVKLGDTCTPVEGIQRSLVHINQNELRIKKCVTGELTQGEYDILVDFSYQYGTVATCKSPMVRLINAGYPIAACEAYTQYKKSGGYDCSTMINGKRNTRCWGVWQRNLNRRDSCLKAATVVN